MYLEAIGRIRDQYGNICADDSEKIKAAASILLNNFVGGGPIHYPLQVVQLLKNMGFELFRTRFKNTKQSGLIMVDSSLPQMNKIFTTNRVILVNEQDSTAHQRFTIAHELAHYIFDYNEQTQATYYKAYLTSEIDDTIELRANRFAAELLMPTDDFCKEYNKLVEEQDNRFSLPNTITALCKHFDAPATAVQRRLLETKCENGRA